MFVTEKNDFARWLEGKYVAWMAEAGEYKTQTEFAEWLEVDPVDLNRHMNGTRIPKRDNPNLPKYLEKLGPEVYDLLGFQRPDAKLKQLQAQYDATPPDKRDDLLNYIDQFLIAHGYKRVD